MQKLLIPVLVLAIVALTTSNVLPILSMNELNEQTPGVDDQQNDNTFSNNHLIKDNPNAFLFNEDVERKLEKIPQVNFMDADNNDFNDNGKNENYYVKGFRKEQWHNYPRQLDRLNKYFYEHHSTDKRNLDPDERGNDYEDTAEILEENLNDIASKEYQKESNADTRNIHNEAEVAAAVINPLLIFRIRLACYNKDLSAHQSSEIETDVSDNNKLPEITEDEISLLNEVNPESSLNKVKREGKIILDDVESAQKSNNRTMDKRIFSLWSRLQSLNHKGHELHHRRHLYALYGLPDSEGGGGGGVLTAETRATFMRPPGSPLRWG